MRPIPALVIFLAVCHPAVAAPVTTGSLIDEMADLGRLTRFPAPAYRTIQFSSYDHRSTVPGGPHWFDNSDGFGEEPVPNFEAVIKAAEGKAPGEYLMCDVAGPGAVVRLWTAQITGTLRMWLDDRPAPVYDGPAETFFLHPYDGFWAGSGLTPGNLKGTLYQNTASYAPIPFARRCRMVWYGNPRETHFYQIQVRTYDKGTEVVSFSPGDLKDSAERIRRAVSALAHPDAQKPDGAAKNPVEISARVAPHATVTAVDLKGPGAMVSLTLNVAAPNIDEALRQTLLHVHCDGEPRGQVESPLGDFFGAGPGINPYSSLPFTVAADGSMTCRYVMPYKESASIAFENRGDEEVLVTGSVLPGEYAWDEESSMHFRARWRVENGLTASGGDASEGVQDLPFLIARGRGVYVGTAIMLLNPNNVPTPWGNWWGEGDEKVFVDDDVRPSIFGTGSEDYFNYAWSAPDLFALPYCGQPRDDGPANRGFVSNYRWHLLDPLPFAHSIAFYMELFSHERTEGVSYGRISYYYARPGTLDDHVTLTDAQLRLPELPATWEPAARFGAANWEFHACEDLISGDAPTEGQRGALWQGGKVLVWTPAEAGCSLKLVFEAEKKGKYSLFLACMLRKGSGTIQATLDGEPVALEGKDAACLSVPGPTQSRVLGMKAAELQSGPHALVLTAAEAGLPVGIDFLALCRH